MGALILAVFFNPKKKKVILIKIPKNPTQKISIPFLKLKEEKDLHANGKKINEATKNRIKAKVNGGIFCKAYLKIGEAPPQIILLIIKAK